MFIFKININCHLRCQDYGLFVKSFFLQYKLTPLNNYSWQTAQKTQLIIAIIHQTFKPSIELTHKKRPYYLISVEMKHTSSLIGGVSQNLTLIDLNINTSFDRLALKQLETRFLHVGSVISLNDDLFEAKSDGTTMQNGPLSERTDPGSLAFTEKANQPNKQNIVHTFCNYFYYKQDHQSDLKKARPTNLQKLKLITATISKFSNNVFRKITTHFSKTSTADKYIRLVYSIFKLYRALNEKNNLGLISKQLLTTRRILQWDTKYQLIKQMREDNFSAFGFSYKIFELIGNLFDCGAFWLGSLAGKRNNLEDMAERMYSWQDDCYFYQCVMQLVLAVKALIQYIKVYLGQTYSEQKRFQFLHQLVTTEQNQNQIKTRLKHILILSSRKPNPTKQISRQIIHVLKKKLTQKQLQSLSIQKAYEDWVQGEKNVIRKHLLKFSLKVGKYLCDVRTSYNNYSWKTRELNPIVGGGLSVVSSLLGIVLVWVF